MYYIGRINSTFGIKGELKLKNESDFNRFYIGAKIFTKDNKELIIENIREGKNFLIIKFKGYDNIDQARKIANNELFTNEEPKLKEGQYTYQQLLNLSCYTDDNLYIGKVKDVMFLPNSEVLKIITDTKEIKLVPFVPNFIKEVNKEKIIIKPIEGLL